MVKQNAKDGVGCLPRSSGKKLLWLRILYIVKECIIKLFVLYSLFAYIHILFDL